MLPSHKGALSVVSHPSIRLPFVHASCLPVTQQWQIVEGINLAHSATSQMQRMTPFAVKGQGYEVSLSVAYRSWLIFKNEKSKCPIVSGTRVPYHL